MSVEAGEDCVRASGLVLRFLAGEASLAEVDCLLSHLPQCDGCRETFDAVGRQTGAVLSSWEDALAAYDPERLLTGPQIPSGARVPVAIRVMLGAAWETARGIASGLLSPPRLAPVFRSGSGQSTVSSGIAGDVGVSLTWTAAGGLQIAVTGAGVKPSSGWRVRLESLGRTLCEAELDASGLASIDQAPTEAIEVVRVLL